MSDLVETTISSERVFDGALLHVRSDRARLPDGGVGTREWIDHPGASAVVPIFPDQSTALVRQYRYAARQEFLEVPAGKFDGPTERPEDVAVRELAEETGFVAGEIQSLGAFFPCIGYSNEVIHLFTATVVGEREQELSDGEFVEIVRMSLNEAVGRARSGEFNDMKTVVALIRAAQTLGI